jgi:two-component sensor histidine kinase
MTTHQTSNARIRVRMDLEPTPMDLDTAVPCGLILNELVSNA